MAVRVRVRCFIVQIQLLHEIVSVFFYIQFSETSGILVRFLFWSALIFLIILIFWNFQFFLLQILVPIYVMYAQFALPRVAKSFLALLLFYYIYSRQTNPKHF